MMGEDDDSEQQVEFGTLAEQGDEAYYDQREDADDDARKGRIKFPSGKLYGREKDLKQLHDAYSSFAFNNDASRVVFISGYSGTGKSALVDMFMTQATSKRSEKHNRFLFGKFGQIKAGEPFSAISQAMNQFVLTLSQVATAQYLEPLFRRLHKSEIFLGSRDAAVLIDTLTPDLEVLLKTNPALASNEKKVPPRSRGGGLSHDISDIKMAFQKFIKALATDVHPVAFFIDDLQWADDASFQLLTGLLKDNSVKYFMFIGAYRYNEIDSDHQLTKIMKMVEDDKGPNLTKHIELSNLSPDHIAEFIADSIHRNVQDIAVIAEAVYSRTLGNIFFVKQALEELVRRNVIYYDVLSFQWMFGDVTRVQLEEFLSDDVVEMVVSKFRTVPLSLQKALTLAAYTSVAIDLNLVAELLKEASFKLDSKELQQMMELAFEEGLILRRGAGVHEEGAKKSYKFAHDRIREAACALVPEGDERNQCLLCVSKVLQRLGSPERDDWMFFTAARHLNALPTSLTDSIQLAELNSKVGKLALSKGAFSEALPFLRTAAERLDSALFWKERREFMLELKSNLAETELFLGNIDKTLEITEEIYQNSLTPYEKVRADICYLEAWNAKNNRNHSESADTCLDILRTYNFHFPKAPTRWQVNLEKFRFKIAMRGRSLLKIAEFPPATDPAIIAQLRLSQLGIGFALMTGRILLGEMIAYRFLRFVVSKKVITPTVNFLLSNLGEIMRKRENYQAAMGFANPGICVLERFPDERGLEAIKSKMVVYNLITIRLPLRDTIDTQLENSKILFGKGDTLFSLGAGFMAMFGYFLASLRLSSLFESKLLMLEEMATSSGRKTHVVIFAVLRQCLYNLQGGDKASPTPVELKGAAYDEEKVQSELEGEARRMNNREIGMVRALLGVIFNDESVMADMLDRLDQFQVFDIPVARQLFRMSWAGFAAIILAQKSDKYMKWRNICFNFFKKLSDFGSAHALAVHSCMKALDKPSLFAFDEAIQVCGNEGLLNLAALMNERCGCMLLEQGLQSGEEYLKCALWLYQDWGAAAKVSQLQSIHPCLRLSLKEKAPSNLSAIRHAAALLAVPKSAEELSEMRSAISSN